MTPTYNRARLLPRAWASLIGQSEQGFEWIVVDDGSTDNTRDVVEGFNDPRIRYVWQENQGVNGARNRGDREVRAEYIIYLDSDDELLHATILAEMLAEIRATPAEVAWVSFTVVDGERNPGLSHVPADRLETGYLDHVCEQTIWGEFFSIYRRDATRLAAWPRYNGLEALRHWQILRHRSALLINRPGRIYHTAEGDNLTGARSMLRRASQMAAATGALIGDHKATWLEHCPSQLGKYSLYRAAYLALSGPGHKALRDVATALRYGGAWNRAQALLLGSSLALPRGLRQRLFLFRSRAR